MTTRTPNSAASFLYYYELSPSGSDPTYYPLSNVKPFTPFNIDGKGLINFGFGINLTAIANASAAGRTQAEKDIVSLIADQFSDDPATIDQIINYLNQTVFTPANWEKIQNSQNDSNNGQNNSAENGFLSTLNNSIQADLTNSPLFFYDQSINWFPYMIGATNQFINETIVPELNSTLVNFAQMSEDFPYSTWAIIYIKYAGSLFGPNAINDINSGNFVGLAEEIAFNSNNVDFGNGLENRNLAAAVLALDGLPTIDNDTNSVVGVDWSNSDPYSVAHFLSDIASGSLVGNKGTMGAVAYINSISPAGNGAYNALSSFNLIVNSANNFIQSNGLLVVTSGTSSFSQVDGLIGENDILASDIAALNQKSVDASLTPGELIYLPQAAYNGLPTANQLLSGTVYDYDVATGRTITTTDIRGEFFGATDGSSFGGALVVSDSATGSNLGYFAAGSIIATGNNSITILGSDNNFHTISFSEIPDGGPEISIDGASYTNITGISVDTGGIALIQNGASQPYEDLVDFIKQLSPIQKPSLDPTDFLTDNESGGLPDFDSVMAELNLPYRLSDFGSLVISQNGTTVTGSVSVVTSGGEQITVALSEPASGSGVGTLAITRDSDGSVFTETHLVAANGTIGPATYTISDSNALEDFPSGGEWQGNTTSANNVSVDVLGSGNTLSLPGSSSINLDGAQSLQYIPSDGELFIKYLNGTSTAIESINTNDDSGAVAFTSNGVSLGSLSFSGGALPSISGNSASDLSLQFSANTSDLWNPSGQAPVPLAGFQSADFNLTSNTLTLSTSSDLGNQSGLGNGPLSSPIVWATFSTVTEIGTVTTTIGPNFTVSSVIGPPPTSSSNPIAGALDSAIGSAFGSALGRIIAGSDPLAQIAVSTALGTTLGDIVTLLANLGPNGNLSSAYSGIIKDFPTSVEAAGAGAVASYLTGELVDALDLPAFPAAVLNTAAGHVVTTIASNLVQGLDPISGINPETGVGNAANNLSDIGNWELLGAQFIGSQIGSAIYQPSTIQGDEGAAVASAVGSAFIAYEVIEDASLTGNPAFIAAAAVLAILDQVLGGVIGDLFGQETTSHISEANFSANGSATTPLTFSYYSTSYQNGPIDDANGAGEAVVDALNDVLAAVGGTVLNVSSLTNFGVGFNTDAAPGYDSTGYDYTNSAGGLAYYYYDNTAGTNPQYWAVNTPLQTITDYAILRELSEMVFSGGDPYMERAIDAVLRSALAPTSATLAGYIQVAQDYETYEANTSEINALIEADPTSQFSQNWISELVLAGSMGFGTSVQGGTDNDTLGVTDGDTILIGGGGDDTYVINPGDGAVTVENGVSYDNAPNGNLILNTPGLYFTESSNPVGPGNTNLTFTQSGADLVIGWSGSTDNVTLKGWFAGSFAELNQITLANGTIISLVDIQKFFDQETIVGNYYNNQVNLSAEATYNIGIEGSNDFTDSSNAITGGDGADTLAGGSGANDFINGGGTDIDYGGGGADIYEMDAPGNLTIYNNETTTGAVMGSGPSGSLVFGAATGDTLAELSFAQSGENLVIDGENDGSVVTIENWFAAGYAQLSSITSADGVTITYDASYNAMSAILSLPNGGYDYEYWGLAGQFVTQNQYYTANMVLYEVVTQTTADTWIVASGLAGASTPALSFTLPTGFTASQISFADSGGNLVIADDAGATVTVDGWFTNPYAPLSLVTADGVTITDTNGVLSEPTTLNGSAAEEYWLFGTGQSWSYGAAGVFNLAGSGDTLSVGAGSAVSLEAGDPSDTINISSGSVSEASGVTGIIVNGSNNALTMNGGNYLYIESGTGNTVYNDVAGDTVDLGANTSTTITGSGGYFGIQGTGITVTASGESVATVPNASFTISGNSDTITLAAGAYLGLTRGDENDTVNMSSNSVGVDIDVSDITFNGSGDLIVGGTNDSLTLSGDNDTASLGTGSAITLDGGDQGDAITLGTGSTVTLNQGDPGNTLNLSSGSVTEASGVTGTIVNGSNNALTMNGGDYFFVESGTGNTVYNDVAGDTVDLGANTSTTITGSGGYFGIQGTGITVTASGESVATVAGAAFTVDGNGNTITLATGAYLGLTRGDENDTVNMSSNSVGVDIDVSGITFNGSGDLIVGGTNDAITLSGDSDTVSLGTGSAITLDGGDQADVITLGTGSTVSLNQDDPGNTLNLSSGSVTEASGVTGTIVNGSNNALTMNGGDYFFVESGTGNTVYNDVAGDSVDLGANTSTTITGSGGYFVIQGTGITVTGSGESVATVAGASFTIDGNGNTITLAASTSVTLAGDNDIVTLASGDTVAVVNGTGEIIDNDVAGNVVNLYSGASATINGSGGYIGIAGTGISVTASNETINTIPSASFTINGLGNTITLGSGSGVSVNDGGSNNTITLTANSGSTVIVGTNSNAVVNGSGNTVDLSGPGNTLDASDEVVNLMANALAIFYGDSNAIYGAGGDTIEIESGNNNVIYDAGNTITLASGLAATIVGNSNVLTMGSGDTVAVVNGTGETIDNDVAGNVVNLYSGASATINGSGGYIGIAGTGISVTASNETINTIPSASFTINGLGNTITLGSGSGVSVNDGGSNNTITLTANSGSTVIVGTNSNAVVNGSGNTVDLSGPGNTLDASGEVVNLAANALAIFYGDSNAIYGVGGDTIEIESGNNNVIYDAGNTITLASGLAASIVGNSNVLTMGSGDTVAILGGAGETIDNDVAGNVVNLYSGASATINGSGGYIGIAGTGIIVDASGETIGMNAGASFVVNGNDNVIEDAGNAITNLDGSYNSVYLDQGDYLGVSGTSNTIYNDVSGNDVNLDSNSVATITGSGGYFGILGTGITVTAYGEGVGMVAGASFAIYGNGNTIIGAASASMSIYGSGNTVNLNQDNYLTIGGWNAGVANDTVVEPVIVSGSAYSGSLQLGAGMTLSQLSLSQSGENLVISFKNSGSQITIQNWFAAGYAQLASIMTADGYTIANANGVLSAPVTLNGSAAEEYWLLSSQQSWSFGSAGVLNLIGTNDALSLAAGSTVNLAGANGADAITISNGTLNLAANAVTNLNGSGDGVYFTGTGDYVGVSGTGDIVYGDVAGDDVNLAPNTSATITGTGGHFGILGTEITVNASGESVTTVPGASFTVTGNSNSVSLIAGDTMTLVGVSDIADVSGNSGAIVIDNGASGAQTASNTLAFGSSISDEQLWFVRSGNNLQIDLMGTQDEVTVNNWFSAAGNQFSEVTAGGLEIDAQISQLVQAMATYSGNNPGFNPTAVGQAPSDANLQAAIAAAWHH